MLTKFMVLPVLLGLSLLSIPALADPITGILSIQGGDMYSNSLGTIAFVSGSGSIGGVSTGSLSPFTAGNPVNLYNFSFGSGFVPGAVIFSTTEAGTTASLAINSVTSTSSVAGGLALNATGMLSETGYTSTPTAFTLTSQDGGKDVNVVTFSGTAMPASVVPEPTSMALFGTGLLGVAGFVRRKLIA